MDGPQVQPPSNRDRPAGQVGELAAALGFGAGLPVPEGIEPGGDCPPAGAGAAQEIADQAVAPVALKPGLTLAYTWMRTPQEEYECLIHVESVDSDGINTTLSCNHPERGGPFRRRVCRADLRGARMLHTVYGAVQVIDASGEERPETIVGATAFSLSSAEFANLKTTGAMTHRYVELGSSDQLAKDGVGELRVEGRETTQVIVNDGAIEIPVIRARGTLTARQQTRRCYGIYFDFNSDRIRKASEPVLKEIGDVMKRHPDWTLSIDGHTDNIGGNAAYNLELSRRRSGAVRTALVNRFGIAADRLTAGGHGASAPKATNDTPEGRARNRRVELVRQ